MQAIPNATSIAVNENTALTYSAIYRAVGIIADTIASLPIKICRRVSRNGREVREVIYDHPVSLLLNRIPNGEQTPMTFKECMAGTMALWGNAYVEIQYDTIGMKPAALWPLRPDRMMVLREENEEGRPLIYRYTTDAVRTDLSPRSVLHVPLFGDGITGKSPIKLAATSIGVGIATEGFGATFFGNGSMPSGILTHPGKLNDKAKQQLREALEQRHKDVRNSVSRA